MKRKLELLSLCFLLLVPAITRAQDPHFGFCKALQEYQSPALLGVQDNQMQITSVYRNQWRNVGTAFQTYGLCGNAKITRSSNSTLSAGGFVFNQSAFSYSSLLSHASIASNVLLSDGKIFTVGIGAGTRYEMVDPDALMWTDQFNGYSYDPSLPHNEYFSREQKAGFDLSAGASYRYISTDRSSEYFPKSTGTMALGFWHLNQGQRLSLTNEQTKIKSVLLCDVQFALGDDNKAAVNPWMLGMMQGKAWELLVGTDFKFFLKDKEKYSASRYIMSVGGGYRLKDAAMARIMFDYAGYGIGVLYEINTSPLKEASKGFGCVEILLRYSPSKNNFSLF